MYILIIKEEWMEGFPVKEVEVVTVTEAAAFQIKDMMKQNEEEGANLRVTVHGGGCSGLSYGMGFDREMKEGDIELDQHGIHIVVDKDSAPVLKGTVIDYKQSLMGGGFTIENPNAIASCGCGSSFRTATNEGKPENC
ncbi:iron-sulfur cluster assembly accessory protein [Bacillus sp. REN10]|uniref:HesB/IscA family protein n=1 Tax=Bacillus sp. REN10 TaxID=2782541 RepID=UPI001EED76F7|nr:iron-sulfur cluster assembly accessory protein [Bacillus sp. REN10]